MTTSAQASAHQRAAECLLGLINEAKEYEDSRPNNGQRGENGLVVPRPSARREFFRTFQAVHLERLLVAINGAIRIDTVLRFDTVRWFDGANVSDTIGDPTKGAVPSAVPGVADKPRLLLKAVEAAREIANDSSLNDKQALQRLGLMLAGSIHLIHPFQEGNGRTARVLSYLIIQGWAGSSRNKADIADLLTERGDKLWRVSPSAEATVITKSQKRRAVEQASLSGVTVRGLEHLSSNGNDEAEDLPEALPQDKRGDVLRLLRDEDRATAILIGFGLHSVHRPGLLGRAVTQRGEINAEYLLRKAIGQRFLGVLLQAHDREVTRTVEIFIAESSGLPGRGANDFKDPWSPLSLLEQIQTRFATSELAVEGISL